MNSTTYQLRPFTGLLSHGPGQVGLLHDYDETGPPEIDALVASGDCFITLATVLDEATELLRPTDEAARPQLEKLTRTLLYLQRHYKISRKRSDHRQ